jgi:hypothetical protein
MRVPYLPASRTINKSERDPVVDVGLEVVGRLSLAADRRGDALLLDLLGSAVDW